MPRAKLAIHLYYQLAGGLGFEPRLTESESAVLPLNYPPSGAAGRHRLGRQRGRPEATWTTVDSVRTFSCPPPKQRVRGPPRGRPARHGAILAASLESL